jgi:hypothetical protein
MKTLRGYTVAGALYHRGAVTEALVGDKVRLYLDTEAKPGFPEFVEATIQHPISLAACNAGKSYNFLYNEDDLNGAAAYLMLCDVIEVQVFFSQIFIPPSTDPHIGGAVWNSNGTLIVSETYGDGGDGGDGGGGGDGGLAGTVRSVGLSAPNIFSVSGSPVNTTGTLALNLVPQAQRLFFGSPSSGSGIPAFRAIQGGRYSKP